MEIVFWNMMEGILGRLSPVQRDKAFFLFSVCAGIFLAYASCLPFSPLNLLCGTAAFFCAGGAAVTCVFSNFAENEELLFSVGIAMLFMAPFIILVGGFSYVAFYTDSRMWQLIAGAGDAASQFLIWGIWDICYRQINRSRRDTHSKKTTWCWRFWGWINVVVFIFCLGVCKWVKKVQEWLEKFYNLFYTLRKARIREIYVEFGPEKVSDVREFLAGDSQDKQYKVTWLKGKGPFGAFTFSGGTLAFQLAHPAADAGEKRYFLHAERCSVSMAVMQRMWEFMTLPSQFCTALRGETAPAGDTGAFHVVNVGLKYDEAGDRFLYITYSRRCTTQWKPVRRIVGYDMSLGRGKFLIASDFCDVGFPEFHKIKRQKKDKIRERIQRYKELAEKAEAQNHKNRAAACRKKLVYWEQRNRYLERDVKNQRREFFAQLASRLTKTYDAIVLEHLDVKAMGEKMAKDSSQKALMAQLWDRRWGWFLAALVRAGYRNGCQILRVGKDFPSTQRCHICCTKNTALRKDSSTREWRCPHCGEWHERDRNAAMNLLEEGRRILNQSTEEEKAECFLTKRK